METGCSCGDWLHVEDHCEAIDLVMHKGKIGETDGVGGNSEKTNLEIAKKILELMGKDESAIEFVKDRPGHDPEDMLSILVKLKRTGLGTKNGF